MGSPVGVLGMGPEAGREVLAGDDSESLAAAVVRALSDPDLRGALGAAGRRWVAAHHGSAAAANAQRELVRRAALGPRQGL